MLRKFYLLFSVLIVSLSISAQTHKLQVDISGFKEDGLVHVMLYKEGQAFDVDSKICLRKVGEIKNKQASVTFSGLKAGKYAILVFHDQNKNGKMDTNFIGMPKEGVGASNNQKGMPSFSKAAFIVNDNKHISINIKYLF